MAPEQITNADSAGPSADLYSVSVIFYELLVDVLPQGHWQPPSGGRADIPAGVDKLIERGLSNRAANRPQSAAEYRSALQQAVMGYAPQPVDGGGVVGGGGTKFPTRLVAIGGGGLAVLAAGALLHSQLDREKQGNELTVLSSSGGTQAGGSALTALSGSWIDGENQASYSVQVNGDGSFSGAGTAAGEPISLQGGFQGQNARYAALAGGIQYPGTMQWDGQCHIDWRLDDGSGGGRLHVNHAPGAPCP
jgi:hypothetical protein